MTGFLFAKGSEISSYTDCDKYLRLFNKIRNPNPKQAQMTKIQMTKAASLVYRPSSFAATEGAFYNHIWYYTPFD